MPKTEKDSMTIEEAKQCLKDLGILDWQVKEILKAGGQGITLKVASLDNSAWGVFKMPKDLAAKESGRLSREIEVLAELGNGDNGIAPLLKHSGPGEDPWFITKYGEPFRRYWINYCEKHKVNEGVILERAVEIVDYLLVRLARLHNRPDPIIHRDIKPENIVMIDDKPNFIDFGVAFWTGKERLTDVDDAVGNRRFSPDIMMYRMDRVVPWLDVFMMSQLFMWMLAEEPTKNWARPVDFRFVPYSSGYGESTAKVFAFTGVCSEETIGPKNAAEMSDLLRKLFYKPDVMEKSDLSKVLEVYQQAAKAESDLLTQQSLDKALAQRKIEAVKPIVALKIKQANDSVTEFVNALCEQKIGAEVERRKDNALDNLLQSLTVHPSVSGFDASEMITIRIKTPGGRAVYMGLSIYIHLIRARSVDNPFCFRMGLAIGPEEFFCMDAKGQLYYGFDYSRPMPMEMGEVFRNWFENPANWRL